MDREAEALLAVEGLTVAFGGLRAVDGVDLQVRSGITGLIGPNGAGKTTLIDALTGFVTPSAGSVTFAGHDVTGMSPAGRAQLGLARTFQSLELFEDLSVADNLRVVAERPRWWGPLVDAVRPHRPSAAAEDVTWALSVLGLEAVADARPGDLSHGRRKLVAVARALAGRPRLLLLDEPAAGLDNAETARLGEHLRAVADQGIALVLVDHDMGLVLGVCDVVHVLDQGSVIAAGVPDEVRADPAVIRAYLGVPS